MKPWVRSSSGWVVIVVCLCDSGVVNDCQALPAHGVLGIQHRLGQLPHPTSLVVVARLSVEVGRVQEALVSEHQLVAGIFGRIERNLFVGFGFLVVGRLEIGFGEGTHRFLFHTYYDTQAVRFVNRLFYFRKALMGNDLHFVLKIWCYFQFKILTLAGLCQHKLLGGPYVLTLVGDWCHSPIRIAEQPVLARTLKPAPVLCVKVNEMHLIWSGLRSYQKPSGAVEETYLTGCGRG